VNLSAKQSYLVTYDIADPKRLMAVYKVMKGFGDHLQLSVFRCELTARQLVDLKMSLLDVMHAHEDQVLLVDLGPADGRGCDAIVSLGRVYTKAGRQAIVI
jgi:CRISPR-associated protein Cas2